jgi:hypothetical protein
MLHKNDKWFADWRDASGKRKRKAFPTRRAALAYQTKQHRRAAGERHPRPTHRPAISPSHGQPRRRKAAPTTP